VTNWLRNIDEHASEDVVRVLVGNKVTTIRSNHTKNKNNNKNNNNNNNNVTNWLRNIDEHASEDVVKVLVGNKVKQHNNVTM